MPTITSILKYLVILVIWLALSSVIYSQFTLNNLSEFKACLKTSIKSQEVKGIEPIERQIFHLLSPKLFFLSKKLDEFKVLKVFEKQKWDISTDINPVFGQLNFLISNQTSTVRLFKFGNLCMISDQIAPHLVQLPSKIISTNPLPYNFINILKHIYLLDFSCLPQLVLSAKKENIKSSINQEYLTLKTNCNLSA